MGVPLTINDRGSGSQKNVGVSEQSCSLRKRSSALMHKLHRSASSLAISSLFTGSIKENGQAPSMDTANRKSDGIPLSSHRLSSPMLLNAGTSTGKRERTASDASHLEQPTPYFLQRVPTQSVYPTPNPYRQRTNSGLMRLRNSTTSFVTDCTLESLTTASSRSSGETPLSTPKSANFPPLPVPEHSVCLVGSKPPRPTRSPQSNRTGSSASTSPRPITASNSRAHAQQHRSSTTLRTSQSYSATPLLPNRSCVVSDGILFYNTSPVPSASVTDVSRPVPCLATPVSTPKRPLRKIVTRIDGSHRGALRNRVASLPPDCPLPLIPVS